MDDLKTAMATLAQKHLGRAATDEEISAMAQEVERDSRWIAPHAYGRNGAMFHLEPASFRAVLLSEIGE